jgi:hypothetical protein
VNKGSDTYSRRRFSMNSGLNLSPVTYSVDGKDMFELSNSLRTQSMFVGERWDDACREITLEVVPKENEVLKASPGRGVWRGEYWEIALRRWLSSVEYSDNTGQQTHLCRN